MVIGWNIKTKINLQFIVKSEYFLVFFKRLSSIKKSCFKNYIIHNKKTFIEYFEKFQFLLNFWLTVFDPYQKKKMIFIKP